MKKYRLVHVDEKYISGWTIGKVYKLNSAGNLVDDDGVERLTPQTYNDAGKEQGYAFVKEAARDSEIIAGVIGTIQGTIDIQQIEMTVRKDKDPEKVRTVKTLGECRDKLSKIIFKGKAYDEVFEEFISKKK